VDLENKNTKKYSQEEFLSGILIMVVSLWAGIHWQTDPEASRFDHYLGIVCIVLGVGIAIVMIRRLSEMYSLGYFRAKGFAKGEEMNMLQKIISTITTFIFRVTHPSGLLGIFSRSRTKRVLKKRKRFGDERWEEHYEAKKTALEEILGLMDNVVGHSLIPFVIGGALDMYYFSSCMPGTVFCSMELIDPDGEGPMPSSIGVYELISCTKHKNTSTTKEPFEERKKRIEEGRITTFEKINHRMCGIMTMVSLYSFETILNPGETCELPTEDETICLIFDEFDSDGVPFKVEGKQHGLLLCIEIFRSEMEYAMKHGSDELLAKLKKAEAYPYSDLEREPVV